VSGEEIRQFLPDRAAEIEAKVAALRASMEQKSYGDVVTGAAEASADLKRAIADSRVARAKNRNAMENEWGELLESMPKLIESIDKKIAVQGRKPPKGMEKDAWKQLVESYDAARNAWGATAAGMKKETFDASVKAGRDAKVTISGIADQLGIQDS
jgi:alkylation response protein AidB-like acyl-CoA dehydrogenase